MHPVMFANWTTTGASSGRGGLADPQELLRVPGVPRIRWLIPKLLEHQVVIAQVVLMETGMDTEKKSSVPLTCALGLPQFNMT